MGGRVLGSLDHIFHTQILSVGVLTVLLRALDDTRLRPRCRSKSAGQAVFDDGITLLATFVDGESAGEVFLMTVSHFWVLLLPGNLPGSGF